MCMQAHVISRPHGLQFTRLRCPLDFPRKNTGVGCHFFLHGILQIQGSNPYCLLSLLHYLHVLHRLRNRESSEFFHKISFCFLAADFTYVTISLLLLLLVSVVSDSVRPHRRQPTRLPRPWDAPGKNAGVGCHFLLQYMQVKSESEVAQLCPTLGDPTDCSLPGSSAHEIFPGKSTGVGCHCLL